MAGIVLIILGSMLLIIGIVIYSSSSGDKNKEKPIGEPAKVIKLEDKSNSRLKNVPVKTVDSPGKNEYIPVRKVKHSVKEGNPKTASTPEEKGYDFEKYVIQKFNKEFFKVKEWAGDKYVKGIYAETTTNPDMVFEFKMKDVTRRFSVECKWRNKLKDKAVEFSTPEQLERYRKYEKENNTPVYLVMGIGGKPSYPAHLYVIPLKNIRTSVLHLDEMHPYEKITSKDFFYDVETGMLR